MSGIEIGRGAEIFASERLVERRRAVNGFGRAGGISLSALRLAAFGIFALQQRVFLELGFDIFRKLEIGELQQLDRLLQLRRHHQGLALFQLEALCQRHLIASGGAA